MVWTLIGMSFSPRAKLDGASDDFFLSSSSFDFYVSSERSKHAIAQLRMVLSNCFWFQKLNFFSYLMYAIRVYGILLITKWFMIVRLWTHNWNESAKKEYLHWMPFIWYFLYILTVLFWCSYLAQSKSIINCKTSDLCYDSRVVVGLSSIGQTWSKLTWKL